jgi:hypothetical protein
MTFTLCPVTILPFVTPLTFCIPYQMLLTSLIWKHMYSHISENNFGPSNQIFVSTGYRVLLSYIVELVYNVIPKIHYFLENCIRSDDWQRRYIRGGCSYICRTKQSRKTRAFWEISWYRKMYKFIDELSHKPRLL